MNEELLKLAYQSLKRQFDNISKITIDGDTIEFYGGTITYPFFGQRSIRDMVIKEKGD